MNTEGYALPESIHVVYRYDYGYEYELTENAMYNGYTYDRTTGDIVVSAPYGSSTTVVIRADGTEKAGNPAAASPASPMTVPTAPTVPSTGR